EACQVANAAADHLTGDDHSNPRSGGPGLGGGERQRVSIRGKAAQYGHWGRGANLKRRIQRVDQFGEGNGDGGVIRDANAVVGGVNRAVPKRTPFGAGGLLVVEPCGRGGAGFPNLFDTFGAPHPEVAIVIQRRRGAKLTRVAVTETAPETGTPLL